MRQFNHRAGVITDADSGEEVAIIAARGKCSAKLRNRIGALAVAQLNAEERGKSFASKTVRGAS